MTSTTATTTTTTAAATTTGTGTETSAAPATAVAAERAKFGGTVFAERSWASRWATMTAKRSIDIVGACVGIVVFGPLMLVIAGAIGLRMGRPILFRQPRPGLNGKIFSILKFRTMTNERGPDGELLPDSLRLTWLGKFLRSTSFDELPGFFNVLWGEMSLVGPRPLLVEYLPRYSPEQARRHAVKPGLTGLAQINGRNAISWDEKFFFDVCYVDRLSIWLDVKIIALTLLKIVRREGISARGHATMPNFLGHTPADPPAPSEQI